MKTNTSFFNSTPHFIYQLSIYKSLTKNNSIMENLTLTHTENLTLKNAETAIAAAKAKAKDLGTLMNIAIVDAGANLIAFVHMDNAWLGSIDIAQKKARTARFFNMPTGDIGKLSQPGGALYNIEHSNGGLITFPGGLPIKNASGVVIGAIGVSGDSVQNDHLVAQAGVDAVNKLINSSTSL
jgi:uncharacterized protein GlcG (DUF336 family)